MQSAYLSETLRGAGNGVPHGQWDAVQGLGLRKTQVMRYVVGLQALRLVVPSLSNSLIKDTSLVSVIAVSELMLATKEVIATPQPFPLHSAAAAIYWAMSASFEGLQKTLERRLRRSYQR